MSYLLQDARRPDSIASRPKRGVRVDEHTRLNRPGLYGDAFVRVYVEDTTYGRRRQPHFDLQIADCTNVIRLEFSLADARLRENSLFKIDTLLGALARFREALAVEADLAASRP